MCVGVFVRQKTAVFVVLLFVVFFALVATQSFGAEAPTHSILPGFQEDETRVDQAKIQMDIAELPLSFVANAGQADANVRFVVKDGKHTIFFTPQEIVFAASEQTEDELTRSSVVRLRFAGANADVRLKGQEELLGVANFFWGNDQEEWRANVPTYEAIMYHNLYPGVDLIYSSKEGHLKSEFIVAPGADPTVIIMEYSGASGMYVRQDRALVLETPVGEFVEAPPLIYQVIDEERVAVQGVYCVLAEGVVGFALGEYDPKELLVIDPALVYSTYVGSAGEGHGDIAVDSSGNVYVTGGTTRRDFPTRNAYQSYQGKWDVFITKLDPSGSLIYSTYLGGGESEEGYGIAVDSSGNVYVTGYTESSDFPTRNAYQSHYRGGNGDVFVAKLGPSGSLIYSTYLGGEEIDWGYKGSGFAGDGDKGYDIAVDSGGNVYVTGYTESSDFPTLNAYQSHYQGGHGDVFVAKLEPSGSSLVYSTFLGGEGADKGYGIAVDNSGNAYVTGYTGSGEFPTQNAYQSHYQGYSDALVAKLDSSGSLIYSTYLGGKSQDKGYGIAVDNSGNAYVTGFTQSTDFPTLNANQSLYNRYWAFVTKLDPSGSLVYSTYLGGLGNDEKDEGRGIAVDSSGYIYVTGNTASRDFPTRNAYQSYFQGYWDAFVTKLDPSGSSLVFSTYLGGEGQDIGESIAVDNSGNIYVAGNTTSRDFPTRNAYQSHYQGYFDVFVAKLDPSGSPNQPLPIADAGPDQTITDSDGNGQEYVVLDGSGSEAPNGNITSWLWTENGNQIATGEAPTVTLSVGTHKIILTVIDDDGATDTDDVGLTVTAPPTHTVSTPSALTGPSSGQVGQSITFSTRGAACSQGHSVQYQFDWGDGRRDFAWNSSTSASHSYSAVGTYQVKVQARCSTDPSVTSDWSLARTVNIESGGVDTHPSEQSASNLPGFDQDSVIGEYINPLNLDDCLEVNADGTCYMEILGLNVGTTGRWKVENGRISLLFPDGTTFRGTMKTDAILLEGFGMLPIVWIKPTKSPPRFLDVAGKYVKEDHPDEHLILNADETYTKTERGIGDQLLTYSGEWELDDHAITLFYLGDRTSGISAAVLENRLYFTGLLGTDIWIGEPREEPTPEEETIPGGGEPPKVEWERFFSTSGEDRGMTVQQTDDGGYIVLGNTTSKLNGYDIPVIWLIKTDAFGIKEWERTFGGEAEGCEGCGYSVEQTSDGGYIIIGTATSNQLDVVWLIKTDAFGIKEWERTFGGDAEGCEGYGYSVQQTSGGGYILVGEINRWTETYSDIWVIKTDSSGNREWENAFGGPSRDWGLSVEQTNDGGYIIGNLRFRGSGSDVNEDIWLIKMDRLGNKEWDRLFGGTFTESIGNIQQTDDGGYVVVGTTQATKQYTEFNLLMIRTDASGNEEWSKKLDRVPERTPAWVSETQDGGFIVCTSSYAGYESGGLATHLWLLKTDASGDVQWSDTLGENARGTCVEQTKDGGYVALGTSFASDSEGDIWLMKLKGTGVAPQQHYNATISELEGLIDDLVEDYRNKLNEIKGYTLSNAESFAYFDNCVSKDEVDIIVDFGATLFSLALTGITSTAEVIHYKHTSVLSVIDEIALEARHPHVYEALRSIGGIDNIAKAWTELTKDELKILAGETLKEISYQLTSKESSSFRKKLTDHLEQQINEDERQIEALAEEAKQVLWSLPPEEAEQYVVELHGLRRGNAYLLADYSQKASLTKAIAEIREIDENDWKLRLADFLWGASIGLLGVSAHLATGGFLLPATITAIDGAREQFFENRQKLSVDAQMAGLAAEALNEGFTVSSTIYMNTQQALKDIRDRNYSCIPQGSISVENKRIHKVFESGTAVSTLMYLGQEEVSDVYVTKDEECGEETKYSLAVSYKTSFTSFKLFPGLDVTYENLLPVQKTAQVEDSSVRFQYGVSPDGSALDFYLFGKTENRLYGLEYSFIEWDPVEVIEEMSRDYWMGFMTSIIEEENYERLSVYYDEDTDKIIYKTTEVARIKSPGELRMYDSEGRVTGLVDGRIKEEIPGAVYDDKNRLVVALAATDSYHYEVAGTEEGRYGLEVISVDSGKTTAFSAANVPTMAGTTHQYTIDWAALSKGERGVTLEVDSEGNGSFETTLHSQDKFDGNSVSPAKLANPKGGTLLWLWILLGASAVIIVMTTIVIGMKRKGSWVTLKGP